MCSLQIETCSYCLGNIRAPMLFLNNGVAPYFFNKYSVVRSLLPKCLRCIFKVSENWEQDVLTCTQSKTPRTIIWKQLQCRDQLNSAVSVSGDSRLHLPWAGFKFHPANVTCLTLRPAAFANELLKIRVLQVKQMGWEEGGISRKYFLLQCERENLNVCAPPQNIYNNHSFRWTKSISGRELLNEVKSGIATGGSAVSTVGGGQHGV